MDFKVCWGFTSFFDFISVRVFANFEDCLIMQGRVALMIISRQRSRVRYLSQKPCQKLQVQLWLRLWVCNNICQWKKKKKKKVKFTSAIFEIKVSANFYHIENSKTKGKTVWILMRGLIMIILTFWCLTLKAPVTTAADDIHKYFFIVFQRKQDLIFQVNPLLGRGFTWKIKPYFLWKIKVKKFRCWLLQFLFGALRVNC